MSAILCTVQSGEWDRYPVKATNFVSPAVPSQGDVLHLHEQGRTCVVDRVAWMIVGPTENAKGVVLTVTGTEPR